MKTALSIVQASMKRMGLTPPTSLVNQTDPAVLQQIEILYSVCEEIRQAQCWAQQKRRYTFTTESTRRQYPLPTDFFAPLLGTHYDEDAELELDGPLSDGDVVWRVVRTRNHAPYGYRIFGPDINRTTAGQFQLDQSPPAGTDVSFEYLTGSLFIPASWDGSDTTLREAVSADTDLCIFDSDLVKLGFRAKYREENGGDFAQAKAEFDSKIAAAVARLQGRTVGSMVSQQVDRRFKGDREGGFEF